MINNMKRRLVIRVQSYNIFLFYEILWKNFVNQNSAKIGVKVSAAVSRYSSTLAADVPATDHMP